MPDLVYCEDCEFPLRRRDGAELPAWRWLCMRSPRVEETNFVHRSYRLHEPWRRCSVVNTNGQCIMFEPRRRSTTEADG